MKRYKKTVIACVSLVILLFLGYLILTLSHDYFMKQIYPLKYSQIVAKEATANRLDPALVYSVIKTESNFNETALSRAGAVGLMQITPDTFEWLQTKLKSDTHYAAQDLRRPEINIRYGCKFLSLLLQKYPQKRTAVSAYNAGIGTVNSWLKDPLVSSDGEKLDRIPYPETRKYVESVFDNYEKYTSLYQFNSKGENVNG
ncbi:MAG TPA: lytic transglycosylase domain-containing protein [Caproiciproducens sp.]|nr:lytic transglycosylase domain-containing protein [Caproiciproducens sp.]